jgi:hypothetical protein
MSNRLKAIRVASKARAPLTLCEYLSEVGGIRLNRGDMATMGARDLLAMDADRWHRAKPFRKKLVRDDDGHTPDDAAEIAWEAGYFPRHDERPTIAELLDLIATDLQSGSVYSEYDYDELERIAIQEGLDQAARVAMQTADAVRKMEGKRVIPLGAVPVMGQSGDVAYLYETSFRNRKGRVSTTFYAKAFMAGEKRHAWHKPFASAQARDDAVYAFFAENMEGCYDFAD